MRQRSGFTIVELTVAMGVLALGAVQTAEALAAARAKARVLKDSTQLKSIHQAWVVKSADYPNEYPTNPLPTPGLVNRVGSTIGRGEEDLTKNDHASLFSLSIALNMCPPSMCISSAEVSPNVAPCTDYDMTQYDPQNDKFWDGDRKGEGVFTDASPGHFKANLGKRSNVSFACMPLLNPAGASSLKSTRRTVGWRNGGAAWIAVLGNRGVRDGIDGTLPDTDLEIFRKSRTLAIHGPKTSWEGNVVFGDNHVEELNTFYSHHCTKLTDLGARVVDKDSNCASDESLDNYFREDDTKGFTDMWLCVVPFLTMSKDGKPVVPSDHALLFD